MKTFKLFSVHKYLIFIIALSISGCGPYRPLPNNYFNNKKTVGIIYIIDPIRFFKTGEQGNFDEILTPGTRFIEALNIINKKKIIPTSEIKNLYEGLLNSKGKSYIELDYNQFANKIEKFEKPSSAEKKYYQYDLRPLKSQFINDHEIDEVLIISVKNDLVVYYDGVMVFKKWVRCDIESEIVDLNDNSIMYYGYAVSLKSLKGKWETPPEYENLSNSFKSAISTALAKHKAKLNKQ